MSNLIERLRDKYVKAPAGSYPSELLLDAADEIERLQAVVDAAEAYRLADFKDQEETGQELDRALAALEDE